MSITLAIYKLEQQAAYYRALQIIAISEANFEEAAAIEHKSKWLNEIILLLHQELEEKGH